MKRILLEVFVYTFALYLATQLFPGLKVHGGFQEYLIGGILLAIGFVIVKPILNIISFPLSFITLWIFSFLMSAVILFLVTSVYHKIEITAFVFPGISLLHITIPRMSLNLLLSYIVISVTISVVSRILLWLYE